MIARDQCDVKVTRTVCITQCVEGCGILAHVKDGVLIKVEPADYPEPKYRYACLKALCSPKLVYHPDRLKYPMRRAGKRGEGKWQRISWEEALDTIASSLKDVAAKYGSESIAYLMGGFGVPTGANFIGHRFASVTGATWVSPFGFMTAAQFTADLLNFGKNWSTPFLELHKNPRLCVLWGGNSVETFPQRYRQRTRPAREKGAKIVVINPIFNPSAAKADEWIPIRPGTDAALALGMINLIEREGLCDEDFVVKHTVGPFLVRSDNGLFVREKNVPSGKYIVWDTRTNKPWAYDTSEVVPALRGSYKIDGVDCKPAFQLLVELAEQYPLEKVSVITEIAPDVIRRLALDYATLRPVISEKGVGMQRQFHGDLTYRAITALAAITGNICLNKPETGPLDGLNWGPFISPEGRVHKKMSSSDFFHNLQKGKPYPIKACWVSAQNPANSHPDRNNTIKLLSSMELIVVVDLFMSATAEYADILLPGCTLFECNNFALPYTVLWDGGQPYFQMQPKVIEPLCESKSDLEIFTELAQRMGLGKFFDKSAEEYMEMLLSTDHPSMEGITLEKLREKPLKPKPSYSDSLFYTPSGRLEFYVERLKEFGQELPLYIESPESADQRITQKYPLIFFQTHSKSRHHTHFADVDCLRELDPEPAVNMNPVDAGKRCIKDGDMVIVFNDRGKVKVKARVHEGIRPGVITLGEGWQPRHFAEGSYQELTSNTTNPVQETVFESIAPVQESLVEVKKA